MRLPMLQCNNLVRSMEGVFIEASPELYSTETFPPKRYLDDTWELLQNTDSSLGLIGSQQNLVGVSVSFDNRLTTTFLFASPDALAFA